MEPISYYMMIEKYGAHWVSLLIDRNTAVYLLDSFGIEYIPQQQNKS